MAGVEPAVKRSDRAETAPEGDFLDGKGRRFQELLCMSELFLAKKIAQAFPAGDLGCDRAEVDVMDTEELRELCGPRGGRISIAVAEIVFRGALQALAVGVSELSYSARTWHG